MLPLVHKAKEHGRKIAALCSLDTKACRQTWLALLLTAGEFGLATFMLVARGEIVMLYLAVTYALRETSGGKHYHEIFLQAWRLARAKHPHVGVK